MRSVWKTALAILACGSLVAAQPSSISRAWEIGIVDRPLTIEKLSGVVPGFSEFLGAPKISSDGLYAVYRADHETADTVDLWSVPLDASAPPVRLNGPLPAGRYVREDFSLTPDGQFVLYAAEQEVLGRFDLYRAPIGGGPSVRLSDPTVVTDDVGSFSVTPDSTTVVFTAAGLSGYQVLFVTPAAGGAVTSLTGPGIPGGFVTRFELTPDGERAIALGDLLTNNLVELFSIPIDGSPRTKLSGPLPPDADIYTFAVAPDGSSVAYIGGQNTADVWELFSIPVAGGTRTHLNPTLPAHADVAPDLLKISPDSTRALFLADINLDEAWELYSVPLGGGGAVKLNGALVAEGDVNAMSDGVLISPDSSTVVYRADQQTDELFELYRVPLAGGTVTKINATVSNWGVSQTFRITADSQYVIFAADHDINGFESLFSAPLAGGSPIDLYPDLPADQGIDPFCSVLDPANQTIAFATYNAVDDGSTLLTSGYTTSGATRINPTPVTGGGVVQCTFRFDPSGETLVYGADQEVDDRFELYVARQGQVVFLTQLSK